MSEPRGPYRNERDLTSVIPPDRRQRERVVLAITSATIGAVVASMITFLGVRLSQPPPQPVVLAAPIPITPPAFPPQPVETAGRACVIAPGMDAAHATPVLTVVPRYPGAVLRSSFNVGGGSASFALETCDSVDDVVAFYRNTKALDSDGEREVLHGREFFFSRPADTSTSIEVFKIGITSERDITKIVVNEGTPRQRGAAATTRPPLPRGLPRNRGDISDRF